MLFIACVEFVGPDVTDGLATLNVTFQSSGEVGTLEVSMVLDPGINEVGRPRNLTSDIATIDGAPVAGRQTEFGAWTFETTTVTALDTPSAGELVAMWPSVVGLQMPVESTVGLIKRNGSHVLERNAGGDVQVAISVSTAVGLLSYDLVSWRLDVTADGFSLQISDAGNPPPSFMLPGSVLPPNDILELTLTVLQRKVSRGSDHTFQTSVQTLIDWHVLILED